MSKEGHDGPSSPQRPKRQQRSPLDDMRSELEPEDAYQDTQIQFQFNKNHAEPINISYCAVIPNGILRPIAAAQLPSLFLGDGPQRPYAVNHRTQNEIDDWFTAGQARILYNAKCKMVLHGQIPCTCASGFFHTVGNTCPEIVAFFMDPPPALRLLDNCPGTLKDYTDHPNILGIYSDALVAFATYFERRPTKDSWGKKGLFVSWTNSPSSHLFCADGIRELAQLGPGFKLFYRTCLRTPEKQIGRGTQDSSNALSTGVKEKWYASTFISVVCHFSAMATTEELEKPDKWHGSIDDPQRVPFPMNLPPPNAAYMYMKQLYGVDDPEAVAERSFEFCVHDIRAAMKAIPPDRISLCVRRSDLSEFVPLLNLKDGIVVYHTGRSSASALRHYCNAFAFDVSADMGTSLSNIVSSICGENAANMDQIDGVGSWHHLHSNPKARNGIGDLFGSENAGVANRLIRDLILPDLATRGIITPHDTCVNFSAYAIMCKTELTGDLRFGNQAIIDGTAVRGQLEGGYGLKRKVNLCAPRLEIGITRLELMSTHGARAIVLIIPVSSSGIWIQLYKMVPSAPREALPTGNCVLVHVPSGSALCFPATCAWAFGGTTSWTGNPALVITTYVSPSKNKEVRFRHIPHYFACRGNHCSYELFQDAESRQHDELAKYYHEPLFEPITSTLFF